MADVELLPLPEPLLVRGDIGGLYTGRECQHYARANMEPLRADHAALRAEYYRVVHALQDEQARAERLAEALRKARPFVAYAYDQGIVGAEDAGRELDAAIAQEDRNG